MAGRYLRVVGLLLASSSSGAGLALAANLPIKVPVNASADFNGHIVRLGMNNHFGSH